MSLSLYKQKIGPLESPYFIAEYSKIVDDFVVFNNGFRILINPIFTLFLLKCFFKCRFKHCGNIDLKIFSLSEKITINSKTCGLLGSPSIV